MQRNMDNERILSRWFPGQLLVALNAVVIISVIVIALSHGEML